MAKDLPYFKFFCSEWNDGDITLEDYNIQGVFINVCSYYWSRECILESKLLYKRFKTVKTEIDLLVSENHIKIEKGSVVISFLNEQKEEREQRSELRSRGGKASAKARKLKKLQQESNINLTQHQQVLNSCSTQPQLLREDKIREEDILKNTTQITLIDSIKEIESSINNTAFKNQILKDSSYIEITAMQTKSNLDTVKKYLTDFDNHLIRTSEQKNTLKDYKTHFTNWFNRQDIKKVVNNNPNPYESIL